MKIISISIIIFISLCCTKLYATTTGVLSLNDFFITTTMSSINAEFTITNASRTASRTSYTLTVVDASGKPFLELPTHNIVLAAGASQRIKLSKVGLKPMLWSPEVPTLYTMRIKVIGQKEEINDVRKIGFKSFEIRNNLFYLNGNPYYLRALSQWPVSRIMDSSGKSAPELWNDERFVKKFFQKIKSLNINSGRIGDHELWVKYADEMGILNITGSYSGAGAKEDSVFESNRKNFTPKIIQLRNHVSTAIYTLSNEIQWTANPNFIGLAQSNYEFAQTLDPTRPMIANAGFGKGKVGDIEDLHDYTGWYGGTVLDMDKYEREDFYKKNGGSGQPVTFTECVGTYTAEKSGRFHLLVNKGLSNALRHVGRGGQHPEDPLWYQRTITKEMMEGMRRGRGLDSRVAGSFPYSDYWTWDVPGKTFYAKPAAEVLKQVYSPVLLSFKSWDRHAYAGTFFQGDLYVVNDDVLLGTLSGATASISLEQDGTLVDTFVIRIPDVSYYGTVKIPIKVAVSAKIKSGEARIVMKLNHPKAKSVENDHDVFIAVKPDSDIVSIEKKYGLYDPIGRTATALTDIGVLYNNVPDLAKIAEQAVVVGAGALSHCSDEQIAALKDFAENGGHLLVMEQEAEQLNKSRLLPSGIRSKAYKSLFVNTERPGLLDNGLANKHFYLWNHTKRASNFPVTAVLNLMSGNLKNTVILANCGPALENGVLVEHYIGKGSIIFSQFELSDRVEHDPVAAKVLSNLVDYLAKTDHSFGPVVTGDINFADFDSEAGMFAASLKQGMVINSHNYGRVSWQKNTWPDGRRVTGEQRIINSLGYTGQVKRSDTASGFFYLRPPETAKSFYLKVKNPVNKELWFHVKVNDQPTHQVVKVQPNKTSDFGPWPIPAGGGTVKVTITSHSDLYTPKREKPVIEELVFQKMIFKY